MGVKLKVIKTDNGLEFCNKEFTQLCKENGILKHLTAPGNPKQNGLVKHMNKTLLERVRCMLFHTRLPKAFWGEAVATTSYVINQSSSSAIGFKTPCEMWNNHKPNLYHLRVFGCIAYAHVKQGKLEPGAKKCVFIIGYPSGVKGYKLCNLEEEMPRTMVSRDVNFGENSFIDQDKEKENRDRKGRQKL